MLWIIHIFYSLAGEVNGTTTRIGTLSGINIACGGFSTYDGKFYFLQERVNNYCAKIVDETSNSAPIKIDFTFII